MNIKEEDKFIFHSSNGMDYAIEVVNINIYREPSMKYGLDVWDQNGTYAGDVTFVGDDFWKKNFNKLDKVVGI